MNVYCFISCCIGYFELPVSCLIEPQPCRLLRNIDSQFVERLKQNMITNRSTDSAPIVGLVTTPDGEKFDHSKKESYLYETIGGNNSRQAIQSLFAETGEPFYRTRLVSIYEGLTDKQALRLASQHNNVTSFNHHMTTWDKVCISCMHIRAHVGKLWQCQIINLLTYM